MRLEGQVALVTGGSRGIGRAIALRFAQEGAHLVIAARTRPSLEALEEEIRLLGRQALAVGCDVTEDAAVREMVRRAEDRFGAIDLLVSNAGSFCSMSPLHEMSDAEWEATIQSNLTSAFYACRAVLPGMIARRRGSIVIISSIAAKVAFPFAAPYSAAKAGLLGLTRAAAAEVGSYGIRVNALCPGVVVGTEMHERVNSELQKVTGTPPENRVAGARRRALLRELPSPDDVAQAALFLASPESRLITGQVLNVDGGVCFA